MLVSQELVPYKVSEEFPGLTVTNPQFEGIEGIEDTAKYDLIEILKAAHTIDNGFIINKLGSKRFDTETIAIYMGKTYNNKNNQKPDIPIVAYSKAYPEYGGGFYVDTHAHKIFFTASLSSNSRDSYRPTYSGRPLQTQANPESIIQELCHSGYTLYQSCGLDHPALELHKIDVFLSGNMRALFSKSSPYNGHYAYYTLGEISLQQIYNKELYPITSLKNNTTQQVQDLLVQDRQTSYKGYDENKI